MAGLSNGRFLPLLPAAPLPDTGWSVLVYGLKDLYAYAKGQNPRPLAQIYRFVSMSWSPEIGDTGAGTITLMASDPLWSANLRDGRSGKALYEDFNLFVVLEDGQWRGEWFNERLDIPKHTEPADRTITISGPGAGHCLSWASVLSPYFPGTTPKGKTGVFKYTNLPVMAAWLQLLAHSQSHGAIPYVHVKFSQTKDSGGYLWADTPAKKPKNTAGATIGDVMFTTDSSALNTAGVKAVEKIAGKLANVTYPKISVVGHADRRGTVAHNYQLGLDRANTVANAILAKRPLTIATTSSMGEKKPIGGNNPADWKRSRRVNVTYQTAAAAPDTIFQPERGTTLLDLLKQLTSGQTTAQNRGPINCEWVMHKGFQLHVRSMIGTDRSNTVVYHEGSTWFTHEAQSYDRSQIANIIAVQADSTAYRVATDAASARRWGQREKYVRLTGSYSDKIHGQIADTMRDAYKNQDISTMVRIEPGPYRTPWRDFQLGDWIGLVRRHGAGKPSTIDKQRVMAITVTVDADGRPTYELTLSSTRQTRVNWLKTQVDVLINKKQGISSFIQDDEPTGGVPGDLWTPLTEIGI